MRQARDDTAGVVAMPHTTSYPGRILNPKYDRSEAHENDRTNTDCCTACVHAAQICLNIGTYALSFVNDLLPCDNR